MIILLTLLGSLTPPPPLPPPASPSTIWKVPPAIAARFEHATAPAATPPSGATFTLPELLDLALQNSPATRESWLRARQAGEVAASRASTYYPQLDATLQAGKSRGNDAAITPSIALNYLLFDFGGRAASVEQARDALIAADYDHNAAIQNVVLRVEQAYFDSLAASALLTAQQQIVKQFETNLDSANARHNAGVATIADVLQARTLLAQARLAAETTDGSSRAVHGALATALGISPLAPLQLGALPDDVGSDVLQQNVEELATAAANQRPELAAARADVARNEARVREVRSGTLPEVNVEANAGRSLAFGGNSVDADRWSAALLLRYPLFTGFRNTHDLRAAELGAQISREELRGLQQSVDLQVWTSYYALQTAHQRLATSRELLTAARESSQVARARYREGLGSIIDLLTAESILASATASDIAARAGWLTSLAQLAHDTGRLTPDNVDLITRSPQ